MPYQSGNTNRRQVQGTVERIASNIVEFQVKNEDLCTFSISDRDLRKFKAFIGWDDKDETGPFNCTLDVYFDSALTGEIVGWM